MKAYSSLVPLCQAPVSWSLLIFLIPWQVKKTEVWGRGGPAANIFIMSDWPFSNFDFLNLLWSEELNQHQESLLLIQQPRGFSNILRGKLSWSSQKHAVGLPRLTSFFCREQPQGGEVRKQTCQAHQIFLFLGLWFILKKEEIPGGQSRETKGVWCMFKRISKGRVGT